MKPVVYVDVLFVVNLFMNYIVLWAGAKLMRIDARHFRVLICAIFGALYAVFMFFPNLSFAYSAASKLFFSASLAVFAYQPKGKRRIIQSILVFYGVNFVFGGIMFALFFFTNMGSYLGAMVSNGIFYFHFSVKTLIFSSVISYIVITICTRIIGGRQARKLCEIMISHNGRSIFLKAMIDTGNALVEPITHLPVIVAEFRAIKEILPLELSNMISVGAADISTLDPLFQSNVRMKLRIIPFHSLGKEKGIIIGFKPDCMKLIEENKYIKDVIVGIYDGKLSPNDEYNALLNPSIC
ncbi:MAG: sigma-E processing peptidase SpoIIGA [Clostridia bacterium]|nr:sigma-E processing peptidase SpoIIGA [Clostridia bacterium]